VSGNKHETPGVAPLIGQTVGNYQVKALLGEGGMGTVYLAEHAFMGWRAAIKVLRRSLTDDRVLVDRFMNEARAAKAVGHPNIIEIIDVGLLPDGVPYLLMEMMEGETLRARLQRLGALPVEQALDFARQAAAGLGAAHDAGIVHRDLKPENLFVVPDPDQPGRERIKVLDFGIAKLRDNGGGGLTRSGVLLGTPAYMSPEQCRSQPVDARSDVYALSIILYEMLVGKPPFVSAGAGDVLLLQVEAPPPPVRRENPAVPQFVETAILRGLSKRRDLRLPSMRELVAALQGVGQQTVVLPAPPRPLRATRPMAAPVTPLAWSGSRATRAPSSSLRRQVQAIVVAAAVAIPIILLIASDAARPPRPQPAPPVERQSARPGRLTPEDPPPQSPTAPAASAPPAPSTPPAASAPPASSTPPAATRTVPASPRDLARATPGPRAPAATEPTRRRPRDPEGPADQVTISVLNPPIGLTIRVDGQPMKVPIRLPRDGRAHRIEFQAPKFLGETRVLRADQDRSLYLDNTPLIKLD
jgi:eukaryotic-like serine/threonine-protein kinase